MINYSNYENIIFDFDGVIVDSNFIKEKCIFDASKSFCKNDLHLRFVEYFVKNNGIPREIKINKFFSKVDATKILEKYNINLSKQLNEINTTNGFESYISFLQLNEKKLYVLSGGTQAEVLMVLKQKSIESFFLKVMGGPKTKEENINESFIDGKTIFIGDSLKDYQVAEKYGYDFIFMYGYTQFKEWKEFFKDKNILMSINDFTTLTK